MSPEMIEELCAFAGVSVNGPVSDYQTVARCIARITDPGFEVPGMNVVERLYVRNPDLYFAFTQSELVGEIMQDLEHEADALAQQNAVEWRGRVSVMDSLAVMDVLGVAVLFVMLFAILGIQ